MEDALEMSVLPWNDLPPKPLDKEAAIEYDSLSGLVSEELDDRQDDSRGVDLRGFGDLEALARGGVRHSHHDAGTSLAFSLSSMISAPFSSSTTSSNNRKRQSSVEGETSSLQPPTYLHRRKSVTSNGASSLIVEKNEFTQLSPEALQATVNIDQASFKGKRKATANSELAEKRLRSVTPPQSVRMQKHEVLPLLRHAVTFAKRNHWPIAVVAEKSAWTNLLDIGMFHLCKENVSKGLVSTAATATSWCYHEVWKHLSEDLVEDLWTQVKETPPILKEPESDDEITLVSCTPAPTQTSPPITSFQAVHSLYTPIVDKPSCSMVSDLPAIAMTITTGWHRVVLSRLLRVAAHTNRMFLANITPHSRLRHSRVAPVIPLRWL